VPEIDFQAALGRDPNSIEPKKQTAHTIAKISFLNSKKSDAFMEALLKERSDLGGLPFAMGDACRTKGDRNLQFTNAARVVRQCLAGQQIARGVPSPGFVAPSQADSFWSNFNEVCTSEDTARQRADREQTEHVTAARIAALMQILAPESASLRLGLVKYLSATAHVEATQALAKLALFSAEDDVRLAAVEALKLRRERDYTALLVAGLRYPLPAVARRASEALVKLERSDLIPQLLEVLEQADPRAPQSADVEGKQATVVRELVRINHHRNCLLCHATGTDNTVPGETLTAPVPVPNEPLQPPSVGYGQSQPDLLVRLDVTYLRQDFSLMQPVADAGPWPEMQRFDFFVRSRALSSEEADAHRALFEKQEPGVLSPYHRAALTALRELTGKDAEPTADAWRKLLGVPATKARKTASF
jgi:hypothetical protein